jgi:hypothetical protein
MNKSRRFFVSLVLFLVGSLLLVACSSPTNTVVPAANPTTAAPVATTALAVATTAAPQPTRAATTAPAATTASTAPSSSSPAATAPATNATTAPARATTAASVATTAPASAATTAAAIKSDLGKELVGQTITVESPSFSGIKATVTGVEVLTNFKTIDKNYTPKNGAYLVILLEFENVSKENQEFMPSLSVTDGTKEYEEDLGIGVPLIFADKYKITTTDGLKPGKKGVGFQAFDVPLDAKNLKIKYL